MLVAWRVSTPSELNYEVCKAIAHDLVDLQLADPVAPKRNRAVDLLVQPGQERELRGYTKEGNPRYNTRHRLDITNQGDEDAENVRVESADPEAGMHLFSGDGSTVIQRGQTRRVGTYPQTGGWVLF
jgi:hypothetical protein